MCKDYYDDSQKFPLKKLESHFFLQVKLIMALPSNSKSLLILLCLFATLYESYGKKTKRCFAMRINNLPVNNSVHALQNCWEHICRDAFRHTHTYTIM